MYELGNSLCFSFHFKNTMQLQPKETVRDHTGARYWFISTSSYMPQSATRQLSITVGHKETKVMSTTLNVYLWSVLFIHLGLHINIVISKIWCYNVGLTEHSF